MGKVKSTAAIARLDSPSGCACQSNRPGPLPGGCAHAACTGPGKGCIAAEDQGEADGVIRESASDLGHARIKTRKYLDRFETYRRLKTYRDGSRLTVGGSIVLNRRPAVGCHRNTHTETQTSRESWHAKPVISPHLHKRTTRSTQVDWVDPYNILG